MRLEIVGQPFKVVKCYVLLLQAPVGNARQQALSQQMQRVLQPGLDIAVLQEEMEACLAVKTRLFPHQRRALSWCVNHEKIPTDGIAGGLLADDMGLGKSLVVISLILTNFHDDRPLVKPELGFIRPPFGGNLKSGKGKVGLGWKPKGAQIVEGQVGNKVKKRASSTSLFNRFGAGGSKEDKENRFSFGSNERRLPRRSKFIDGSSEEENDDLGDKDFIADDEDEDDEFDAMASKKSFLKEKSLRVESIVIESSDEEDVVLKELSQSERQSAMMPTLITSDEEEEKLNLKLNLDGFMTDSESEEDERVPKLSKKKGVIPVIMKKQGVVLDVKEKNEVVSDEIEGSSGEDVNPTEKQQRRALKRENSDPIEEGPSIKKFLISKSRIVEGGESDASLPDMDQEGPPAALTLAEETEADKEEAQADDRGAPDLDRFATAPGVRLIIPPRIPAKQDGRRRATLLVCPTSLISHWVEQLNIHLHQGVQFKLKVHHGQSKAFYAGDLETQDLVITSYGTLAAEFIDGEVSRGPLLTTKWLRVVLDEGHKVKNHLSKAHKAALQLDVERKWVVTGTPIQNNLMEFWSLLNFLGSHTYAGRENMRLYKRQIEKPCEKGNERGYQRLKVTNR